MSGLEHFLRRVDEHKTVHGDRLLPSFFIIGERKCGTSSLFRYLVAHPNVLPGKLKEPDFFSHSPEYIARHWEAYKALFPEVDGTDPVVLRWPELDAHGQLYEEEVWYERMPGRSYITGEASANTMEMGQPEVVHSYLPEVKLIVLLREPVARTFSHYRMYRRFQQEGRPLGFVVGDFETDVRREMEAMRRGQDPGPLICPSLYVRHLKPWWEAFGPDRIRVWFTEQLAQPHTAQRVLEEVLEYLGLPPFDGVAHVRRWYNRAPTARLPEELEADLRAFFQPWNEALAALLGRPLPWYPKNDRDMNLCEHK